MGMRTFISTLLVALVGACGGGGEGAPFQDVASTGGAGAARQEAGSQKGCTHQHIYLTVERLRVQKASADGSNGVWMDFILPLPRQIDLLNLNDAGVLESLGVPLLPLGEYQEVRLVLASEGHAVQPANGPTVALDVPSGAQSGLKLQGAWKGTPGPKLDLVLADTFSCDQVVQAGTSGVYRLKPTLQVQVRGVQMPQEPLTPGGLVFSHNPGPGEATSMSSTITIEAEPGQPSSFFWAQQFFINSTVDHDGYFGLQTGGVLQGRTVDKMAIFSIWNAVDAFAAPGAVAEPFSGEGSGWKIGLAFDWKQGVPYTFTLSKIDGHWWQVTLRSPGAAPTDLGRIRITQDVNLEAGGAAFTEYFQPIAGCQSLPSTRASFSSLSFDGAAALPATDANTGGPCAEQARGTVVNGTAVHETGNPPAR